VVGQQVMECRPGHRPHDGVVLLHGVGGTAVARREVVDLELPCRVVVARRRLEDAVRLAVRAQRPRNDGGHQHDVGRALEWVTGERLEQRLLLVHNGRVLVRQQPRRRTLRDHCRRQGSTRRRQDNAATDGQEDGPVFRPQGAYELAARATRGLQRQVRRGGRGSHRRQGV